MSIIKIKRSKVSATPVSLQEGELAYSEVSDILFIGTDGGNIDPIGGVGHFASKQYVTDQGFLTANQEITVSGDATGSGSTSIALTLANSGVVAGTYPKVTVDGKGRVTVGASLTETDIPSLSATKISDLQTVINSTTLDSFAAPVAPVDMATKRITSLGAPLQSSDAATKQYVDDAAQGLLVRASVKAATTGNIDLAVVPTEIDGVTVGANDRILVKAQTDATQNGIYAIAADGLSINRTSDADNTPNSEFRAGVYTFVLEGTINGRTGWVATSPNSTTYTINGQPAYEIGVSEVVFSQFSAAGAQLEAGDGLALNGNIINVAPGTGISVTGDVVGIADNYPGQTRSTRVGPSLQGLWMGMGSL